MILDHRPNLGSALSSCNAQRGGCTGDKRPRKDCAGRLRLIGRGIVTMPRVDGAASVFELVVEHVSNLAVVFAVDLELDLDLEFDLELDLELELELNVRTVVNVIMLSAACNVLIRPMNELGYTVGSDVIQPIDELGFTTKCKTVVRILGRATF